MKNIIIYVNKPFFGHLLFWIVVFLYFILSVDDMRNFESNRHLFECYGLLVLAQIVTAYVCMNILMPKFLDQKKVIPFTIWMIILLFGTSAIHSSVKAFHLDSRYPRISTVTNASVGTGFMERLTSLPLFLSKSILLLTPTGLLLISRFYKNQQKLLKINEQKKIAELTALKQQLNPHFLFNTLNNLYALAIEKSDKTPEVIERLSDILDYMLYSCNDKFVSLKKETELIENYLALEKIRYGQRVEVTFLKQVDDDAEIAPLLLLTFIENAFKHGVTQALDQAKISISLTLEREGIVFSVFNTKPNIEEYDTRTNHGDALGLKNVKQQLQLLYQNNYDLKFDESSKTFLVQLILKRQ